VQVCRGYGKVRAKKNRFLAVLLRMIKWTKVVILKSFASNLSELTDGADFEKSPPKGGFA
jgi:hypothetical protein